MATDEEELFDKTIDAYAQSTGHLPEEHDLDEIVNLVANYEEDSDD